MATATRLPVLRSARRAMHRGQRGVVLIIALVMMITITFAGLALFRQVGLGAVIVGNLAFKQGATSAADRGIEAARTWLTTPTLASIPRLQGQDASGLAGYFPAYCYTSTADWGATGTDSSCQNRDETAKPPFDPLNYNWATAGQATVAAGPDGAGEDLAGNTVNYVIHRMCNMDGSTNEVREFAGGTQAIQSCVLASSGNQAACKDLKSAKDCFSQTVQPYYRVTARVQGPRNTLSYVEVMLF